MNNLINTFIAKQDEWLIALVEHVQISLLSLLIAMLIAIPVAIIISKNKKVTEVLLQMTGVLQTIPSLALLGLFIPLMGIGTLPAIVTLVIYAVFPILQNTVIGLREIDPSLQEAATAFGMTRWEKLKKFELPLATPVIISGVRTSAVMIIGTATLAALIGAGGLGNFILLGIDRNNSSLILIGAISSAALAILFSFFIKVLEKQRLKRVLTILGIISAILLVSLTKFGMAEDKKIVIAGKLGAEPEIIINMYKELIEDNNDIKVEIKPNFGKTTFLYEALKSGDIDIYPEFTGTVTSSLLKNSNIKSNDSKKVYEYARDEILKQDKLVLLEPMKYQNTYAIAIPRKFAEDNNIQNISDLKRVQDKIVAGFTLEFNDREDGKIGLKKLYGLDLKVKTMEPSLRYQAIASGDINVIDAYSTDSKLRKYNLVVLNDDKHLFPPYQGAPLLRTETLKEYPELESILSKLSGKITEDEMRQMNYEVDVKGKSAEDVAHDYLLSQGLASKSN